MVYRIGTTFVAGDITRSGPEQPGSTVVGKYVSPRGYFLFSRTNTNALNCGGLQALGTMSFVLKCEDKTVRFSTTYTFVLADPSNSFSITEWRGLVTGATIDGAPRTGVMKMTPIDGGQKFKLCLTLY